MVPMRPKEFSATVWDRPVPKYFGGMRNKMLKNIFKRFTKTKLALQLQGQSLSLLLFEKAGILKYESLFFHETSDEVLREKVRNFIDGKAPAETVLILARSEVLQKELTISNPNNLKESLEGKLTQVLP